MGRDEKTEDKDWNKIMIEILRNTEKTWQEATTASWRSKTVEKRCVVIKTF